MIALYHRVLLLRWSVGVFGCEKQVGGDGGVALHERDNERAAGRIG